MLEVELKKSVSIPDESYVSPRLKIQKRKTFAEAKQVSFQEIPIVSVEVEPLDDAKPDVKSLTLQPGTPATPGGHKPSFKE